jgi:hypothetical protein
LSYGGFALEERAAGVSCWHGYSVWRDKKPSSAEKNRLGSEASILSRLSHVRFVDQKIGASPARG